MLFKFAKKLKASDFARRNRFFSRKISEIITKKQIIEHWALSGEHGALWIKYRGAHVHVQILHGGIVSSNCTDRFCLSVISLLPQRYFTCKSETVACHDELFKCCVSTFEIFCYCLFSFLCSEYQLQYNALPHTMTRISKWCFYCFPP